MAIEISEKLKIPGFEFIKCESFNDIDLNEKNLTILDVVEGIDKPILIKDIDKLRINKSVTAHDFDLAFNLKLMKAMGKIEDVKIIGIPQKGGKAEIFKEIKLLFQRI